MNGVKKLVKFFYSILSRLGVIETSSPFRQIPPPPPPRLDRVKETIGKVLDKDTSLGEKIRTLFREQGITIASILTAIGMAIGVLVEALLPGGGATTASGGGGEPPPKDEKGLNNWVRNKLKVLATLLGKLGMKAAKALPGIIGGIISWILNRAKDVVGWVSQNLSQNRFSR